MPRRQFVPIALLALGVTFAAPAGASSAAPAGGAEPPAPPSAPAAPAAPEAGPALSPEEAQRAAVRDILQLAGAFSTMQTWFGDARAAFEASKPDVPADLMDNVWQESLASFDLLARERALLDACGATLTPGDAAASLAFLRGDDMTLIRQLMAGASQQIQAVGSGFLREVAQACCAPDPTDFMMVSRLKAAGMPIDESARARLDAIFAYLDVGPRARVESMLVAQARGRYPEATDRFWEQEPLRRALAMHAEDLDRAMANVFLGHDQRLAAALAGPEAIAHQQRWRRMKATLDAQGQAFIADLVQHARARALERGPALQGR